MARQPRPVRASAVTLCRKIPEIDFISGVDFGLLLNTPSVTTDDGSFTPTAARVALMSMGAKNHAEVAPPTACRCARGPPGTSG